MEGLHEQAALRLAAVDQRYTSNRRALVEALVSTGRPVTIPEILTEAKGVPKSSAYRSLAVLCEAGIARRLPAPDDFGRFELTEELSGNHHHHLVCWSCGTVADIKAFPRLERAMAEAVKLAAAETGFEVRAHRLDLEGHCPNCH